MSERLYSLVLRLYPRAFRDRYGEEMARVFHDRLRDERAVGVWFDVIVDAAVSIPRQHLAPQQLAPAADAMYPASAAPVRVTGRIVAQGLLAGGMLGAGAVFLIWTLVDGVHGIGKVGWLVPMILCAGSLVTVRKYWRFCRALKSVRADLSSDSVTVAYEGAAPLTLQRGDITGLHDFETIGLRIQTADPARDLWVPARSEAYANVRAHLEHWAPVTITPFHFVMAAPSMLVLAALVALGLLVPIKLIAFVVGVTVSQATAGLIRRDLPLFKRLLPVGALAILLARWLW